MPNTTLTQFIATHNITLTSRFVDCVKQTSGKVSYWQNQYKVTLHCNGHQSTFDWHQGNGIDHDPDVRNVLECLQNDSQAGDMSFSDFCNEFGYDTDSITALKTHKACKRNAAKLEKLLGTELYQEFLYADLNDDED